MTNPIIIGSDHAGFELKEEIKKILQKQGIDFKDIGATSPEPSDDYPVYISQVASAVSRGEYTRGIAIDGMGIGASIVANRFPRVRAAISMNSDMARISRAHNDSNILILGGWATTKLMAEEIITIWLKTKFDGGRHARRIGLIDDVARLKVALNHLESIESKELPDESIDEQLVHLVSKGIERFKQLLHSEKRHATTEARLSQTCPTSIVHNGHKISALMIDLTSKGAQFKANSSNKKLAVQQGDAIEFEVKTPYGISKGSAEIIWVDTSFYTSFGVRFTKISSDAKDPLRSLMESM